MHERIFRVTFRDFSGDMPRESLLKSIEEFLEKCLRIIFLEKAQNKSLDEFPEESMQKSLVELLEKSME